MSPRDPHDLELDAPPGLPQPLPPGEEIVWQGRPEWKAVARRIFKVQWLAVYFGALVVARAVVALARGEGLAAADDVALVAGLSAACLGIVAGLAYLQARATVYTITTRRVVMQIGVALSTTWNLPFKRLAAADLEVRGEGDGDVVLALTPPDTIRGVYLWPHVHGGLFGARPALRALAEPRRVAALLADAVARWSATDRAQAVR